MALDLITGFPGFIGRRLVARLLEEKGVNVVALVEPRMLEAASAAAAEIDADRVEVLAGDISERRLALSEKEWGRLTKDVRRVYHLAAIYDLAVPIEAAQRVNVDGTGNVLELCAAAKSLERLIYVSTAYVAGTRQGVVYEHELVMGQDFKNHYESTKFQAEVWVREEMDNVPTTILRPAIVVGDSTTGETQKFDGPYYILRAISETEKAGRPMLQFGRGDATFNVVPVDHVVEAIASAAAMPAAEGETFHLVDPEPLTSAELVRALAREYGAREPKGRVPARAVEAVMRIGAVRERFGNTPRESIAYLNHPVTFDSRRTVDLLATPPRFAEYAGAMVAFYREHEDDPAFGAKK